MKSTVLLIMLMIIILIPALGLAAVPNPVITLLNEVHGGSGIYHDPYILYTNRIEWRFDETYGANRDGAIYSSTIKMSHHRSCAQVQHENKMSWSDINGKTFFWDGVCGIYFINLDVSDGSTKVEAQLFFYLKTPPVKTFNLPYHPPSGNQAPKPEATFLNMYGGSGSYNNRYLLDGPFIRFRIDQSKDPNGDDDIKYGVSHWAIYTKGHHPVYSSTEQGETDPVKTYFRREEIVGRTFEWDTRLRPSQNYEYDFVLIIYDQWGEYVEKRWAFYYDPQDSDPPKVSKLLVLPEKLDFGLNQNSMNVEITNTGTTQFEWNMEIKSGTDWIKSMEPSIGTLHAGLSKSVKISVDRAKLAEGQYEGEVWIQSDNDGKKVEISLKVDLPPNSPKNVVVAAP